MALALGGIFLVRYTIQQGLIGPGVRILLGALLALVLVAAGEWTRRKENLSGLPGLPSAHIPSILTAAGTTVAYATVYAAYALYGFLPPPAAFVLLGIVALLTLAAALLHGPALAGLGVIGAYLAPMLVRSAKPDYWALYIYIAVVTAAAFALARMRLWRWLAIAAIVLSALWTLPGMEWRGQCARRACLQRARRFCACGRLSGVRIAVRAAGQARRDRPPLGIRAFSLSSRRERCWFWQAGTIRSALAAFVVLTIATVAIAWRTEAASGAVPVAAILAMVVMAHWAVQMNLAVAEMPGGPGRAGHRGAAALRLRLPPYLSRPDGRRCSALPDFWRKAARSRALVPMLWCASGVFAPLAMLVALYYRIAGSIARCRSPAWRCCSPPSSRSPPKRCCSANSGRASWWRARCSPPPRLPRWRWR